MNPHRTCICSTLDDIQQIFVTSHLKNVPKNIHDIAPSVIPYFRYRDAEAALKWLTGAFGFEPLAQYTGEEGRLVHAEMQFRKGVIMLGQAQPTDDSPATRRQKTTRAGGPGVYLVVEDVDAHHERAKQAGAEIITSPEDTSFGTRLYRARDLEGYEWSFGTYQPRGWLDS